MEKKIKVELSRGEADWIPMRECFVRSFFRYPLFTYVMPEEKKRKEFLRIYMEANYEVAVRSGNAVIICIKQSQPVLNPEEEDGEISEIVGGVMFIPPSLATGGWENDNDHEFHLTYKRLGLEKLDKEAYNRLIRYENWENENLVAHVMKSGIPTWNGAFCAIDPKLSGSGLGSVVYAECMKIMSKLHRQLQQKKIDSVRAKKTASGAVNPVPPTTLLDSTIQPQQSYDEIETPVASNLGILDRISERIRTNSGDKHMTAKLQDFLLRLIHGLSMINHRHSFIPNVIHGNVDSENPCTVKPRPGKDVGNVPKEEAIPQAPLVVAISHSVHAVGFHKKNGFHCAANLAYFDKTIENLHPQLNVHVLLMDPFKTGRGENIKKEFPKETTMKLDTLGKMRDVKHNESDKREIRVQEDVTK